MNRKTWIGVAVIAALVAATVGWSRPAPAQTRTDTAPSASVPGAGAPEKIVGTVTNIDAKSGLVTLRAADGQTHSFKGDAATLNDLKVGDKITLNKRAQASPGR
jgi:Cu/Ag efflux protein CusF